MQRTFLTKLLVLCSGVLVLTGAGLTSSAQVVWPEPPSRLDFPTPYGTLGVKPSGYIYESRLAIDDQEIEPAIIGLLNITYAYKLPHAQAALVSINNGNEMCPVSYRWVVLNKKGYKVSPAFGSCSEQFKVQAAGTRFTMLTPNSQKPDKIDVYVYDGKTIKQHTKP